MAGKGIAERVQRERVRGGWRPARETAPSLLRAQDPWLARWLGLFGLMFLTVGVVAWLASALGRHGLIGSFGGSLLAVTGLALLLFHAVVDKEVQIRRTYGAVGGYLVLGAAILVTVLPIRGTAGTQFLPWGFLLFLVSLLFLLIFAANETEPRFRQATLGVVGVVGAILALTGFIGGNISEYFLLGGDKASPYGLLLALLGLAYLWGLVGSQGTNRPLGYRAGLAFGVLGAVVFLVALGRSVLPSLFHSWGWLAARPPAYFLPSGFVLMALGVLYAAVAAALCSDRPFIVLFRRELAAFFYSPIAYIVLFAFVILSIVVFGQFLLDLRDLGQQGVATYPEPIISHYLLAFSPVFCLVVAVPLLTMRLLSEEQRTGTLEVLLTAPVGETPVVLSKFLAAWVFYMLIWVPWALCLVAFRVYGEQPFEYRPLLIYYLMLACTGANFLGMGLFFSSLTRNQIASGILTFMGMLLMTLLYWLKGNPRGPTPTGAWTAVLTHVSYLDLWVSSLAYAEISPKFYVFHLTMAILWLFLTVKVLEARKWWR